VYEQLTLKALADAAGLDLTTAQRYCHEFAAGLASTGSGRDQRWAPIAVATLQAIATMKAAGYSTDAIHRDLGIVHAVSRSEPELRPIQSVSVAKDESAEPAALPQDADGRTNYLRDKLRARQAEQPRRDKPWWRFWDR
jgi:hypothetical protein